MNNTDANVYGLSSTIAIVIHLVDVDSAPGGLQASDQAYRLELWVRL